MANPTRCAFALSKNALTVSVAVAIAALTMPAATAQRASRPAPPVSAERSMPMAVATGATLSDSVLADVSRLRELKILHPVPNGLKSRDDIRAMVLRDLSEGKTPGEMKTASKILEFLGLVPSGFDLEKTSVVLLTEQIAGFYDPKTRYFYLADWIPMDDQRTIMAHELTHALTDQHFDLRRLEDWPEGDSDAQLAARALVEGDATALMLEYSLDQRGAPYDVSKLQVSLTDLLRAGASQPDADHPAYDGAPDVLKESLQFPYVFGAGFVQALLKSGSWSRVGEAYRSLPASTEQVMHPEKYLSGERPTRLQIPDLAAKLGPGWRKLDSDVNGEFGFYLILRNAIDDKEAARAAAGWAGDRYAFFSDPSGDSSTLVQSTSWDSTGDAAEFFAAYAKRIERRFGLEASPAYDVSSLQWTTPIGTASITRAGDRVVIVEGYRGHNIKELIKPLLPG